MARYTGPKCRLCRREGTKLFLKGSRCDTVKCGVAKRDTPPGMRARFGRRPSGYGLMLREVQKVKRYYGLLQRQFKNVYHQASMMKGNTGEQLLILLERRLDSVLTVMGFAASRSQARQLVVHGHVKVNGKRVRRPSFLVSAGDTVALCSKESIVNMVKESTQAKPDREIPSWMETTDDPPEGKILSIPKRADVSIPVQEHLVVEFCSR